MTIMHSYLSSLTQKEKADLIIYVRLQTKEDSDIRKLFDCVLSYLPKQMTIEIFQKKLIRKLSRKQISNKFFLLKKIVEDFFLLKKLEANPLTKEFFIYEALIDRGFENEAQKKGKKLKDNLNKSSIYSRDSLWILHRWNHIAFFSSNQLKEEFGESLFEKSINHLTTYIEAIKTQYSIEAFYRNNFLKMPSIQVEVKHEEPNKNILECLQLLEYVIKYNDKDSFNELINILINWNKALIGEVFIFTLLRLISFKREWVKLTRSYNDPTLLTLYSIALENNIYLFRGYISEQQFGNILDAGVAAKNYEWVLTLELHLPKVQPNRRVFSRQLWKLHLLFLDCEFNSIILSIDKAKPKTTDQKLRIYWLRIMTLFELEEWSVLDDALKNFYTYLLRHRKVMSEYMYEGNMAFYKIVYNLKKVNGKAIVAKMLDNFPYIVKGSWVYDKIGLPPSN